MHRSQHAVRIVERVHELLRGFSAVPPFHGLACTADKRLLQKRLRRDPSTEFTK